MGFNKIYVYWAWSGHDACQYQTYHYIVHTFHTSNSLNTTALVNKCCIKCLTHLSRSTMIFGMQTHHKTSPVVLLSSFHTVCCISLWQDACIGFNKDLFNLKIAPFIMLDVCSSRPALRQTSIHGRLYQHLSLIYILYFLQFKPYICDSNCLKGNSWFITTQESWRLLSSGTTLCSIYFGSPPCHTTRLWGYILCCLIGWELGEA